ncbi:MAG: hypothetical protein Q9214_003347 [Letrouitia sp. 1 TL-2023]
MADLSAENEPRLEQVDDTNIPDYSRVASTKQPPQELAESIYIRRLVIFSFWVVAVVFGLPTWWWTTSIHRARLPLQEMMDWADGKACKPAFPLQISIKAPLLQENEASNLVRITQHALDDLNEFPPHHLRLQLATSSHESSQAIPFSRKGSDVWDEKKHYTDTINAALTVKLLPESSSSTPVSILRPHSTELEVRYSPNQIPTTSSSSSVLATYIANKLQELFAEEQATIAFVLSSASSPQSSSGNGQLLQSSNSASSNLREQRPDLSRPISAKFNAQLTSRTTRSLKYAPTYHITISLFTSEASPSAWDIESALDESFLPLLDSLGYISNFTVNTQIQLHASFSPSVQSPQYDPDLGVWTLKGEDLGGFINAAEWPLSPSIGAGPTLNFVIYVPSQSNAPLVVRERQATSWLIPQWGGVFILNPSAAVPGAMPKLSKEDIQPVLLTFSHQLLSFLGAPQSPPSLPLQLKTLSRVQAASLLLSASSTMGSLARLTKALPSIAIPETVSMAVDKTLYHLRAGCNALKDGRFSEALDHAVISEQEAERGFFEKSMVGQVYFPDEHKVAVYLPLLGPVAVPLVMSALKELKKLWKSLRTPKT